MVKKQLGTQDLALGPRANKNNVLQTIFNVLNKYCCAVQILLCCTPFQNTCPTFCLLIKETQSKKDVTDGLVLNGATSVPKSILSYSLDKGLTPIWKFKLLF